MKIFNSKGQSKLVMRREIKGLYYVLPFIIGFFAFIFIPMIQSMIYSFSSVTFSGKVVLEFSGLENYKRAFLIDTDFRKLLIKSLSDMVINVPIILIFSMIVAVFLNGKFPGQPIFQIIFFIPVIMSAGIMPGLFGGDMVRNAIINSESMTEEATSMFSASLIGDLLLRMNFPNSFVEYITYAISNILEVLNSSGIQIMIFLIALKAIPHSLYEASSIEGATAWESFWKITFPMVLPQMIVNVFYTVIDSFLNNLNPVISSITDYNFMKFQFGYAASLSWSYFIIVVAILGIFIGILKQMMKHYE